MTTTLAPEDTTLAYLHQTALALDKALKTFLAAPGQPELPTGFTAANQTAAACYDYIAALDAAANEHPAMPGALPW